MKYYLYINGSLADTASYTQILTTYSQGDQTDPTVVKNSYTQAVKLPLTKANDTIFGTFRRNDYGGSFNPLKKVPFEIRNDLQELVQTGYCKLDEVDPSAAGYYSVTLYGNLGSFLWMLGHNSDDTEKTLADLTYYDGDDEPYTTTGLTSDRATVKAAWDALDEDTADSIYHILNFAPALNGYPQNFDSNKAVVEMDSTGYYYDNLKDSNPYPVSPFQILTMESNHTEWGMMDLRASQQRPVIRVSSFLEALQHSVNVNPYTVQIDYKFRQSVIIKNLWMVLPYATDEKGSLEQTATPADYLLALVKTFGLHLVVDNYNVQIMMDSTFYQSGLTDWTSRISTDGRKITPVVADKKYLDYSVESKGTFAGEYSDKYGVPYGSQKVDTGYEFDTDAKDMLEDIPFKGCADVLDQKNSYRFRGVTGGSWKNFPIAAIEPCTYLVYDSSMDPEERTTDWCAERESEWWDDDNNQSLFEALPELNDNGTPIDASGILLLYQGFKTLPQPTDTTVPNFWHLSDASQNMLSANDGKECWDIRYYKSAYSSVPVTAITEVPIFRRNWPYAGKTLEMGKPAMVGTYDDWERLRTVYQDWWSPFIGDRYGKDARLLTVKVNLEGLQVGNELLRHFYHFDNANWLLTKITDYDRSKPGLTTCEFVKVADMGAYDLPYIGVILNTPRTASVDPLTGTGTITVTSNGLWSITITPISHSEPMTASPASGGTAGTLTDTTVTLSTSDLGRGEASRQWKLTLTHTTSGFTIESTITQYALED